MKFSAKPAKPNTLAQFAEREESGAPLEQHPPKTALYRQAEARLRKHRKPAAVKAGAAKFEADPRRLLHELQVHQVELEMQNAELQESRDRMERLLEEYTDLYDFAPTGYFTLTTDSTIRQANLTGALLLGIERSRLVGQVLGRLVAAEQRPAFLAFLKRTFNAPARQSGDFEFLCAGRPTRVVNIEAQRLLDGQECRAVMVDITERKRAEGALRRNEALFAALVAQVPVGVYLVDAQLRLQQVNPKALPVFKNVRPLLGRKFSEIVRVIWPRTVADQITAQVRHTLETGEDYLSSDFGERREDTGEQEFYVWQLQRVTLPAGEHAVVCYFDNITQRKQAEEAQRRVEVLAASNRKLEQEIVQRRTVEARLKQNEQHQSQLLAQSHAMQEQLRHLSRQVLQAQEDERKRISRELHDVIAQTLTGINIRLATLKKEAARHSSGFDLNVARTQQLVQKSVDIVHQFARELRPAVLDDLGLIPALHSFMKNFAERTGLRTHLTAFAGVEELDMPRRTVLFRVAQEALTNVARHAKASMVDVDIRKLAGGICMKVKDNGKSFGAKHAMSASGSKRLGLMGMRERLEMVGGTFEIKSTPGEGTTVIAQMPANTSRVGGESH